MFVSIGTNSALAHVNGRQTNSWMSDGTINGRIYASPRLNVWNKMC